MAPKESFFLRKLTEGCTSGYKLKKSFESLQTVNLHNAEETFV